MAGQDEHGDAARAAAAYRSHQPAPPERPHVVEIDVGEPEQPAQRRPQRRRPAPRAKPHVTMHGFHAPFRTTFLVALGWSAGRATFRLVAFIVLFGVFGLVLWHYVAG